MNRRSPNFAVHRLLQSAAFAVIVPLMATIGCCMADENGSEKTIARHARFEDFSKGACGNSGANVYVSHKGRVQVINKWDLNKDGYVDVIIPNDHAMTEVADALIYWNGTSGFRSLMPELAKERPLTQIAFGLLDGDHRNFTRLPAFGGGRVLVDDLNRDGFPDIVFCNYIHNYPGVRAAFIYWGGQDGFRPDRKTELPTNWASGVAAADLNGDGYLDLVFANNGTEPKLADISSDTPGDAFIYWNSPQGFDKSRCTALKTGTTCDVAVADFNGDGRPDIAFACTEPKQPGIQMLWGSENGYAETQTDRIATSDPIALQAADVNGDQIADLLVITKNNDALVFFGTSGGIGPTPAVKLPADNARSACIADLNGDGRPDIAIAIYMQDHRKSTNSLVYWNSKDGFSPDRRTELPTLGAEDVAAADLNGDGHADLVFANSGDDETYDVNSYVYWGSPTGFAPYLRSDLQGFGAVGVKLADLNGDSKPDILLVNRNSGVDYAKGVPTNIFWGNPHSHYSTASMTSLPAHSPYGILATDLDDDDYNDILFTRTEDIAYGGDRSAAAWLYRGGPDGFSVERRVDVPIHEMCWTVHAADLNRDGYLDLAFSSTDKGQPAGIILWGGADGYTESRRTVLPISMKYAGIHQMADLNRDGYLDLIFATGYIGDAEVFWGSANGYSMQNHERLNIGSGPVTLADLNGDGQLDFIVGGQLDPKTKVNTAPTRIYWGRPDGRPELLGSALPVNLSTPKKAAKSAGTAVFTVESGSSATSVSTEPAFELDAHEVGQICVADLNRDGYLDIVQSNYRAPNTRSVPVFIYWGDKDGKYLNSRRTELPAESACGLQTVDLNHDGYPELIVHNHVKDGEHCGSSYIYWNGSQGLNVQRRTELPTLGPHYSQMIDPGNLYTRKLEEEYVSAPIALPAGFTRLHLTWKAEGPPGSTLAMQVRMATTAETLSAAKWQGAVGEGSVFDDCDAARMSTSDKASFVQYRVLFRSVDGGEWPVLTAVEIAGTK